MVIDMKEIFIGERWLSPERKQALIDNNQKSIGHTIWKKTTLSKETIQKKIQEKELRMQKVMERKNIENKDIGSLKKQLETH